MRLFELTKLGMSGVDIQGAAEPIGRNSPRADHLQRGRRCPNATRERLTFADIINTTALIDFDMLRETREDIRKQPWTQPARCEAGVLYFGIKRAKEEIRRLNGNSSNTPHRPTSRCRASTALAPRLHHQRLHLQAPSFDFAANGFSGNLFPGEPRDAIRILVEYNEPRNEPANVDDDYINSVWPGVEVRELDGVDEERLGDLMEHLSMFDDS
ncbi:hypothetical protein B0H10DRAFT_2448754 [Mycena sp. CBHHK59/15]|nr:hypothetical protein B0H10DRAFT_2448754 [Mycena sp. CBHHK59/15]